MIMPEIPEPVILLLPTICFALWAVLRFATRIVLSTRFWVLLFGICVTVLAVELTSALGDLGNY
jgi:uncharacterized membrane protein